jgi:hypothetical protein
MDTAETVWDSGGLQEVAIEAHGGPLQAFQTGLQLRASKFWSYWSGLLDLEVP